MEARAICSKFATSISFTIIFSGNSPEENTTDCIVPPTMMMHCSSASSGHTAVRYSILFCFHSRPKVCRHSGKFSKIDKFSGALLGSEPCTQGHGSANPKKNRHESVKKRCFGKFPGIAHVHSLRAAYGGFGWYATVWNGWSKVSTMKQDVFFFFLLLFFS